jgi:hypothetical protein
MVTAADMRRLREDKSKVNHETYKTIYRQVTRRIEMHGQMGELDLTAKVPHYVPGRPIYDVSHATRYVTEKLRIAGFEATSYGDATGDFFVRISWKSAPKTTAARPPKPPKNVEPRRSVMIAPADTARRLDFLRMKLKTLSGGGE